MKFKSDRARPTSPPEYIRRVIGKDIIAIAAKNITIHQSGAAAAPFTAAITARKTATNAPESR